MISHLVKRANVSLFNRSAHSARPCLWGCLLFGSMIVWMAFEGLQGCVLKSFWRVLDDAEQHFGGSWVELGVSWEGLGGVLGGLGAHFGGSVAQLGAYMADEAKKSGDPQKWESTLAAKWAPKARTRGAKGRQKGAQIEPKWIQQILQNLK